MANEKRRRPIEEENPWANYERFIGGIESEQARRNAAAKRFIDPETGRSVPIRDPVLGVQGRMEGEPMSNLLKRMRHEIGSQPQPAPERTPFSAQALPLADAPLREQILSPRLGGDLNDVVKFIWNRVMGRDNPWEKLDAQQEQLRTQKQEKMIPSEASESERP